MGFLPIRYEIEIQHTTRTNLAWKGTRIGLEHHYLKTTETGKLVDHQEKSVNVFCQACKDNPEVFSVNFPPNEVLAESEIRRDDFRNDVKRALYFLIILLVFGLPNYIIYKTLPNLLFSDYIFFFVLYALMFLFPSFLIFYLRNPIALFILWIYSAFEPDYKNIRYKIISKPKGDHHGIVRMINPQGSYI